MNGPTHPFPPRRSSFLLVLSNKSANCTVYYDDGTFSVRVSGAYREGYRTSTSGNANIFEGFASSFNLDAAIRYQLNEHIELSLDGTTLTDDYRYRWVDDFADRDYENNPFGRVTMAEARLKLGMVSPDLPPPRTD